MLRPSGHCLEGRQDGPHLAEAMLIFVLQSYFIDEAETLLYLSHRRWAHLNRASGAQEKIVVSEMLPVLHSLECLQTIRFWGSSRFLCLVPSELLDLIKSCGCAKDKELAASAHT